jgi:hypothetical protein
LNRAPLSPISTKDDNAPAACSGTGIPRSASRMAEAQRRQTKDCAAGATTTSSSSNQKSKIKNHKSFSFFPSNASPQPSGEKSARPAIAPYRVGTD